MKALFSGLFILISFLVFAQNAELPVSYYIDRSVQAYSNSSPAILINEITNASQTDKQKVTAIFRWITDNISYNVRAAARRNSGYAYEETDDDTARVLKPLNLRVAETVLKRRMAVCDGYARLFKTLCDHAGIPVKMITGYARTGWYRRQTKFGSNHAWNAVYIDTAWYLLDATWASGHTSFRGDEFFREYNNRYFLSDPWLFIQDHYPDDARWTLLEQPPTLTEFSQSPFRYMGYLKTGIRSFSPSKGVIEAAVGDSIRFEAESSIVYGLLEVVSGGAQPEDTIWNDDAPVIIGGRKKSFTYKITPDTGNWLYVICNGYVILRYRLNIRKPELANAEQMNR